MPWFTKPRPSSVAPRAVTRDASRSVQRDPATTYQRRERVGEVTCEPQPQPATSIFAVTQQRSERQGDLSRPSESSAEAVARHGPRPVGAGGQVRSDPEARAPERPEGTDRLH